MTDRVLDALLAGNDNHTAALPPDHFAAVQDGQEPDAVTVACADSRVPQDGMWANDEPGWLFTPSTIGNQVLDRVDGETVIDGNVLYPLLNTGTEVAVVVGHTGCGAVTAALEAAQGQPPDAPPGLSKWIELLVPIVAAGLEDDRVDPDRDPSLVDQLVEYNVDHQVAALREADAVPDDVVVDGIVYDFQEVYGAVPGRTYLVNLDGETDPTAIREAVPDRFADHVVRLLDGD